MQDSLTGTRVRKSKLKEETHLHRCVAHPFGRNRTPNIFFAGPDTLTSIDPVCVTKNLGTSRNPGIPSHRILLSEPRCSKTALLDNGRALVDEKLQGGRAEEAATTNSRELGRTKHLHSVQNGLDLCVIQPRQVCFPETLPALPEPSPVTAIPFCTLLLSAKTGFCLACAAAAALVLMVAKESFQTSQHLCKAAQLVGQMCAPVSDARSEHTWLHNESSVGGAGW